MQLLSLATKLQTLKRLQFRKNHGVALASLVANCQINLTSLNVQTEIAKLKSHHFRVLKTEPLLTELLFRELNLKSLMHTTVFKMSG